MKKELLAGMTKTERVLKQEARKARGTGGCRNGPMDKS